MRGRIVTAVLAVWALTAVAAYAAVDVTGVVKDPSGGVVADATVTVMTAEQTAVAIDADRRPGPVHASRFPAPDDTCWSRSRRRSASRGCL